MSSFRERVNAHLPVVLQLLSTLSLIVIALTAICGSKSLKKLADSHNSAIGNTGEMELSNKSHKH